MILAFAGMSALGMVLMLEVGPGCGDQRHLAERLDSRRLEDRPLCWWARNREASESYRASSEGLSAATRSCLRLAASSAAQMSWPHSPLASCHRYHRAIPAREWSSWLHLRAPNPLLAPETAFLPAAAWWSAPSRRLLASATQRREQEATAGPPLHTLAVLVAPRTVKKLGTAIAAAGSQPGY